MEFQKFNKIPRLSRDCVITEKIDGTNGQIFICRYFTLYEYFALNTNSETKTADEQFNEFVDKYCLYKTTALTDENDILYIFAGSRNRWLDCSSKGDNHGFAKWVQENASDLLTLGEGRHFGEWYGKGIQRGYGLDEKRFALFNVGKWNEETKPKCCEVVPILYISEFDTVRIESVLESLRINGSKAVPGFMTPEGIIIFHTASGQLFKKTIENDEKPKGI